MVSNASIPAVYLWSIKEKMILSYFVVAVVGCLINNAVEFGRWRSSVQLKDAARPGWVIMSAIDRATSGFDSQKRWSGLTDTGWSLDWAWRVPALYGWRRRRRSRHWTWLSSALPNIHILAANKVKIISFQHPPSHATHNTPASGRDEEILKNQRVIISNQLTL